MWSRRWLVNGLLLIAIAVLVAVGYLLERAPAPQPQAAHAEFDAAAVERIEIRFAEQQLVLQRRQRDWELTEPLRWPADRSSVQRLFRIVDTGAARPLQDGAIDLAKLGLDEPRASVQFGDTLVRFGTVNNIGERRYTLIDSALYLLPDVHLPLLLQGASGFIDRHLLPPGLELGAFRLPDLELRRDSAGTWAVTRGDEYAPQALAALVGNWQVLLPTRIASYDDPRAPSGRIVAELRDGEQIEFLLLTTDPEVVIANPSLGKQYHFRGEYYDRLFTPSVDENSD